MLDFGWTELLMIGVVAVVIIGPKDLPKAMAGLADWVRKLRGLARDFQGQVDDMVKGTELEGVKKAAQGLNRYNVKRQLSNVIDPKGQIKKALDETRQAASTRIDKPTPESTSSALASSAGVAVAESTDEAVAIAAAGPAPAAALADNAPVVATTTGDPGAKPARKRKAAKSTTTIAAAKPAKTAVKSAAAKPAKTAVKSAAAKPETKNNGARPPAVKRKSAPSKATKAKNTRRAKKVTEHGTGHVSSTD